MFNSKSTDHLGFVSRQLSSLLADEQLEPALQRLAEASPPQYSQDIEYLRGLLAGLSEDGPSLGPNPYRAMAALLPSVSGPKNKFFREFVAYVQQSKVVFETYWAGVVGLVWYLAALSAVALVVAIVFGTFVIPSFENMFSQFGAPLPELTQAVFVFGGLGIPLFAVLLALVVGLVVFFVAQFHRRIQQLSPLPRWPSWAPIVGKIAESYNLGLFLNYTRILRECDVNPEQAVADAASAANQPEGLSFGALGNSDGNFAQLPVLTELGVAAKLGNFDSEIIHQCDEHIGNMALALALLEARDRFSLILKIALYLFVATLVVAMYLPIFKMGSVI